MTFHWLDPTENRRESLDDRALQALLDALSVANDVLEAAPRDLPTPAARQTPDRLRRNG